MKTVWSAFGTGAPPRRTRSNLYVDCPRDAATARARSMSNVAAGVISDRSAGFTPCATTPARGRADATPGRQYRLQLRLQVAAEGDW